MKDGTELPGLDRLLAAVDATWPAAEFAEAGGFRLRRAAGAGKRVSSASLAGESWDEAGLDAAAAAMRAWDQPPLFQIRPADAALDAELARRGYEVVDPVRLYAARAADIAGDGPIPVAHARGFMPVLMEEIWAAGGIGPARLAVMDRVRGPSVRLLGRAGDRPAGVAFVAVDGDIAMIHAIEVRETQRRQGVARQLMQAGARFALGHGAEWLALVVTDVNAAAHALYEGLGMRLAGRYHYRIKQEGKAP